MKRSKNTVSDITNDDRFLKVELIHDDEDPTTASTDNCCIIGSWVVDSYEGYLHPGEVTYDTDTDIAVNVMHPTARTKWTSWAVQM